MDLFRQARSVFEDLIELPPAQRLAALDVRCSSNPALHAAVRSLLQHSVSGFMEHSLPEWIAARSRHPQRIGAYEIIKPIGAGGMSVVYLAKRADGLYQQNVAVKLLDRACSPKEVPRRFQRELHALARLEHPQIVRLLEAGLTPEGQCFIIMEYVDGRPLDSYLRDRSIEEVLSVFLEVCAPVAFAHRNLIVHRDLKPSNILVTPNGIPKLLDFGIARLLDQDTPGPVTAAGLNRLTVEYASPEQIRGEAVSTASDVYSLGVVLFELLTGTLPLKGIDDILKADPPLAYTLNAEIKADLAVILHKALRKEPEARYTGVEQFQEDIRLFLADFPVRARYGNRSYVVSKFLRRNRAPVAVGAILIAAILAASGFAIFHARHAAQMRDEAIDAALVLISNASGLPGGQRVLLDMGELNRQRLMRFLDYSPNSIEIMHALAVNLEVVGGVLGHPWRHSLGNVVDARRYLEESVRLADLVNRRKPDDVQYRSQFVSVLCSLGTTLMEQKQMAEAEKHLQRAYALYRPVPSTNPLYVRNIQYYAMAAGDLARFRERAGDRKSAIPLHQQAVDLRRETVRRKPSHMDLRFELSGALNAYGVTLTGEKRFENALAAFTEAGTLVEKLIVEQPKTAYLSRRGDIIRNRASVYSAMGRHREAVAAFKDAAAEFRALKKLEPASAFNQRSLADCLSRLAVILAQARLPGASTAAKEALELANGLDALQPVNPTIKAEIDAIRERLRPLV